MDESDLHELAVAVKLLEHPGLAIKISDMIGAPIEKGYEMLPQGWQSMINRATEISLNRALNVAISTMSVSENKTAQIGLHKLAVGLSGAVGGFFGLPALALELPVSTTLMLRSIMDIAQAQGENIFDISSRMACLEVFALGGKSKDDNASESGYFATRALLAKSVSDAAAYISEKGLASEGGSALVRLTVKIAQRFGLAISEKAAAQAVPILGAAGGSIINILFINHFQDMAKGHFIVRKLERKYGTVLVQDHYSRLKLS